MKPTANIPPARKAALAALDAALPSDDFMGQDAQAALDQAINQYELHAKDKGLATELVYGYLRLRGRIDAVLARFLKAPEKLPAEMHHILGIATYEILFLSRVPSYASVNWAVDGVREVIASKLGGLANAVLRNVDRLGNEVHERNFYGKDADAPRTLAKFYSCPQWIVKLWQEAYGPVDAERLLRAQVMPAALGVTVPADHSGCDEAEKALRAHPALLENSGLGFAFPAGTQLEPFAGDLTLHRGSFAARQAIMELDPKTWPQPIWDACSGRGGKTRVLAELGLEVMASDPHKGRIRALKAEQPKVPAMVASALEAPGFDATPQTILLDVPCSGLGVMARRPDTKWRRTEEDLAELVLLQEKLLDAAVKHLEDQPQATIAYLTCTLNPAENEEQVRRFLERHPNYVLHTQWSTPPASLLGEFFYAVRLARR